MVATNAFRKISRIIEKCGIVKAKVRGIYSLVPEALRDYLKPLSWQGIRTPKCAVVVDSPHQIIDPEPGEEVSADLMSIVRAKDGKYFMVMKSFIVPGNRTRPELDFKRQIEEERFKAAKKKGFRWNVFFGNQPTSLTLAINSMIDEAMDLDAEFITGVDEMIDWFPCKISPGDVARGLTSFKEVQKTIDDIVKEIRGTDESCFMRGKAYLFKARMYEDAIKCFDKAICLNPGHRDAWYYKAIVLGV